MSNGKDLKQALNATDRREQAERCRRLAMATYDRVTSEMLARMAESFEEDEQPVEQPSSPLTS